MGEEDLKRFAASKWSKHNSIDALVSENGRLDKKIESLRGEVERLNALVKRADRMQLRAWYLAMVYRDNENPKSSMVKNTIRACDAYRDARAMRTDGSTPAQDTAETVATEWES